MEYVLGVSMEVQASEGISGTNTTRDHSGAVGTYVEVEGVSVCQFDPEAHHEPGGAFGNTPPQELLSEGEWQFRLPVTGRPIVLLAVGGGNQVFHHWEGDRACRDQGARCELAEPEGHEDGYEPMPNVMGSGPMPDLFVKAVFRLTETPSSSQVHEYGEGDSRITKASAAFKPPRR